MKDKNVFLFFLSLFFSFSCLFPILIPHCSRGSSSGPTPAFVVNVTRHDISVPPTHDSLQGRNRTSPSVGVKNREMRTNPRGISQNTKRPGDFRV